MSITLYEHQQAAKDELDRRVYYALWDEVGCGKSFPIIATITERLRPGHTAVVFTEPALLGQLRDDFYEYLPDDTQARVEILTGKLTPKQKRAVMHTNPDVLIMNYEYVQSAFEWLMEHKDEGLIDAVWCDEAQRLQGFRGMRSKAGKRAKLIMQLSKDVPMRFASSGSPVVNPNSTNIWGIYHFLNPDILGPTLWKFEQEFFYNLTPNQKFKKLVLRPEMKGELTRRMYTCARRVIKDDLPIAFPERTTTTYRVDMPAKLRRVYKELESEAVATLDDGRVLTRMDVLSRLMALQQLASGFYIHQGGGIEDLFNQFAGTAEASEGREVEHIDSSHKDEVLLDRLEQIGDGSVIIWAVFRHEIDHLVRLVREHRGVDIARVDGACTGEERERGLIDFKAGIRRTLIGQPQAAGAGLNLQIAGHAIRYSRTYRLMDWIQTRGRNQRAGKQYHRSISDHEVVTAGTTDEKVYDALRAKLDLSTSITADFIQPERRRA